MTAYSELLVTQDVRDKVGEILGRDVEIECPQDWRGIWNPAAYPSRGKASILNPESMKEIGKVEWDMEFNIEADNFGERYIEADLSSVQVWLPCESTPAEEEDYVRSRKDTTLSDNTVIPEGTKGHVREVSDGKIWVEFERFRNPNSPRPEIAFSSSELEKEVDELRP